MAGSLKPQSTRRRRVLSLLGCPFQELRSCHGLQKSQRLPRLTAYTGTGSQSSTGTGSRVEPALGYDPVPGMTESRQISINITVAVVIIIWHKSCIMFLRVRLVCLIGNHSEGVNYDACSRPGDCPSLCTACAGAQNFALVIFLLVQEVGCGDCPRAGIRPPEWLP